jgi:hypothetical protein
LKNYLKETKLLDFNNFLIKKLVLSKNWEKLSNKEKILNIYNYVRDQILFGYNVDDKIPASKVLKDGYGQCNTKSILFMALLRAVNIPCRLHGFTINKELQREIITGIWYRVTPEELIHTWVEIFYNDKWLNMEGLILDLDYVKSLQDKFKEYTGSFCGYGVSCDNFKELEIFWDEVNTYIQKSSINKDLGVFDDPDLFFKKYKQKLNSFKKLIYQNVIRHLMNRNVRRIRKF